MDWKDVLGQLKNDPDLPQVEESAADKTEEVSGSKHSRSADKLNIFIEKKGRGGKTATIITGFSCSDEELADIAATLKKKLGVGGSARGGEILIQGNLHDKVKSELKSLGFRV